MNNISMLQVSKLNAGKRQSNVGMIHKAVADISFKRIQRKIQVLWGPGGKGTERGGLGGSHRASCP